MTNFRKVFEAGQAGQNVGRTTGLPVLDRAIYGILKKTSIGLAAAPKVGKTTFADYCYLLMPYLEAIAKGTLDDIEWIYFSGEVDRISKEFKVAAFFMHHDFGVFQFTYKDKIYGMSDSYLMGRLKHYKDENDEDGELIPVTPEHLEMIKVIYNTRIVPLFGVYDDNGKQITKGKITFVENLENPTGLNKYLIRYAKQHGRFLEETYTNDAGKTDKKIVGYIENNPKKYTIIITDHIRKLQRERGFNMKENIDKYLEYTTFLRNICSFTFILICHSNRGVANTERLRHSGEYIFPTGDDVKDSGNLPEEVTVFMSLFNANDEKYNLEKHFGHELKDFPNYRSLHITESRISLCPAHIFLNMYGGINLFTPLNPY